MKKQNYIILLSLFMLPVIVAQAYFRLNHPKGSCLENCTGSPGDGGQTCAGCHGGNLEHVSGLILTDVPVEGYTAGNIYTVTLNFSGQSFQSSIEITAENNTGVVAGHFIAGSNTFTTYDSSSVMACYLQDSVFIFQWKAPTLNVPDTVTFYASFNDMFSTILCSLNISLKPVMVQYDEKIKSTVNYDGQIIHIIRGTDEKSNELQIYDILGKLLLEVPLPDSNKQYSIPIPDGLPAGKYIIRMGDRAFHVIKLK